MRNRIGIALLVLFAGLFICYLFGFIALRYNAYGLAEIEFFHQKLGVTSKFDDGPYVIKQGSQWYSLNITAGEAKKEPLAIPPSERSLPDAIYDNVTHVAVVSDVHGQFDLLVRLLLSNGVIDSSLNWTFENGHLVVLGDVFDRGHAVTECFWLIYKLEQQAEYRGGKLHFVLGNHELMVFRNDLAFVNHKYLKAAEILEIPYGALYSAQTLLGQWLRNKPALLKINDCVFVHGGISQAVADKELSITEINSRYRQVLHGSNGGGGNSLDDLLLGSLGPLCYRGFLKDAGYKGTLEKVLDQYNVSHIISGHTTYSEVQKLYDGKLYLVDAGIKYGKHGRILHIENGKFRVSNESGELVDVSNQY